MRPSAEWIDQRRGLIVIAILAVLTIVEYVLAISIDDTAWLIGTLTPFALAKAFLILWYFMHVPLIWLGEGGHE